MKTTKPIRIGKKQNFTAELKAKLVPGAMLFIKLTKYNQERNLGWSVSKWDGSKVKTRSHIKAVLFAYLHIRSNGHNKYPWKETNYLYVMLETGIPVMITYSMQSPAPTQCQVHQAVTLLAECGTYNVTVPDSKLMKYYLSGTIPDMLQGKAMMEYLSNFEFVPLSSL